MEGEDVDAMALYALFNLSPRAEDVGGGGDFITAAGCCLCCC